MPNYQSPGVYIEEISKGPKPIPGAPTNVAAIVGTTERGPVLEPTRLTSWNDYVALFGGYLDASYTPESVFGFFQNGGTALWVVRADNAGRAAWVVRDGANAASFEIRASSPGAWARGLAVSVVRESAGVRGQLYAASVTGPGATVALNGGTTVPVQVSSTLGVRTGMTVLFADADTGATAIRGTVVSFTTSELTVLIAGAASNSVVVARDARVFARYSNGDATLPLASGGGFVGEDLIVARSARGILGDATVGSVASEAGATTLALSSGFGADIPGAELADRTYEVEVQRSSSTRYTAFAQLALPASGGIAEADILRLTSSAGVEALHQPAAADTQRWDFGTAVPAGPVTLAVRAQLRPYREALTPALDLPASPATAVQEALARFAFVPTGAEVTLVSAAGNETITRTGGGWTVPGTAPGKTFTEARFVAATTRPVVASGPVQPRPGDWVQFSGADRAQVSEVETPAGIPAGTYRITFAADPGGVGGTAWTLRAWQPISFEPLRFGIRASLVRDGAEVQAEEFRGLSLNTQHPNYYFRDGVVNEVSRLLEVTERVPGPVARTSYPAALAPLTPASEGTLTPERVRLGFEQLERQQEPAMLACPDSLQFEDPLDRMAAINAMIGHAESFKRFAVVDAPRYRDDPSLDDDLLDWRLDTVASTFAATYAPFIRILNPRPNAASRTVDVPPSGFVLGVIARTDVERGVWKAPANEQIRGAVGLASGFTQRRQDLLNPGGVNLLRAFRGRGIRVWGARNSTDDTQWRYVNVRRLFLFIENSIERATQWVVFEPNNETTWLRVRVSVEEFLNGIWRQGGLAGTTPEQAYRVRVGLGQTMTETDIDLGYLIIEVGVAPTKPAEFVVFQISHKRLSE